MKHPSVRGSVRYAARLAAVGITLLLLVGCRVGAVRESFRRPLSPVDAGYHTNNLLDLHSQADADALGSINDQTRAAERIRRKPTLEQLAKRRSVLCLSGGASLIIDAAERIGVGLAVEIEEVVRVVAGIDR